MVRLEEGEEKKIFVGMEEHPMPRPAFRGLKLDQPRN
jgi:hypothetical protein